MRRSWVTTVAFGFGLGLVSAWALAQDKKPADAKPADAKKAEESKKADAAGGGAMDPGMEAWMKAAQPGKEHAIFKALAGTWTMASKFRFSPDQPWDEGKGIADRKVVMGDRYLRAELKGDSSVDGMPPFEGLSVTGYDNTLKKYFNTWVDNMGTGVMISYGTADATGKAINFADEYPDPMTGKIKKSRSVWTIKDDKTNTFQMYEPGPDGKEFMSLEVIYTKK